MKVEQLCDPEGIRMLLNRNGFRFSKSKGQNFLIDPSVPLRIAEEAEIDKTMGVLEIGPGVGCLTAAMAPHAGKVVCVEVDTALQPILSESLAEYGNVEIVFGDILKTNLPMLISERMEDLCPVVCANLPYNITSTVITALLESECFETITVMVQREVAQRMAALPGTADYGAFSILTQWYAETKILFDVPPRCFLPAPKVVSSVIRLQKRDVPPEHVQDKDLFFRTVRAAFNQRRKTLQNALSNGFGEYSREQICAAIAACGLDEKVRGEILSISEFSALANALAELGKL